MRGVVGNFKFFTFTQNRSGLTGWCFKIPLYAYSNRVPHCKGDSVPIKD
jgi:hypothetical protein